MRIGIDARELSSRVTGVGRYLAGLLGQWQNAEYARAHEFVLYGHAPLQIQFDNRRFHTRVIPGAGGTLWEQVALPRSARGEALDVWFAPAYTAPLAASVPLVVTIHDVSFFAHPEWFRMREGLKRRWLCRASARRARAVITISEFSRRELVEQVGVVRERVHVIPPGVDVPQVFRGGAGVTARVLYVGSIFNRRHVPDLIRAFAVVARAHHDAALDIVGDNRSFPYEDLERVIALEGLQSQVRWHAYVSDDQLRALYGSARVFAFLSEYEGLGLTPLEALSAGIPPVLADTPVARESCGDAAAYVNGRDRPAVALAIERLLYSSDDRARVLAAAPQALVRFDWPRAARDTFAVLEAAARG